jgi:hypothetical protein
LGLTASRLVRCTAVTAEVQGAAQIKGTCQRAVVLRLEELALVLVLQRQELHALLLLQLGQIARWRHRIHFS